MSVSDFPITILVVHTGLIIHFGDVNTKLLGVPLMGHQDLCVPSPHNVASQLELDLMDPLDLNT